MYKVIMVPTDGTGFDREAIRVALRLAERTDAKVRLVRVLANGSIFALAAAAEGTAAAAQVVRSERDRALAELYALAAECRFTSSAAISVDLHSGPVADVLGDYARRHDVDLIVISTHGRSGISRLSLGSVTDSLIRHTSIPVLVVKPASSYLNPQVSEAFRHVVVPLDGSELAERILPRIMALARLDDARITLLHVLVAQPFSPTEIADTQAAWWEKDLSAAEEYLGGIAESLRRHGAEVTTDIVVSQNVSDAIGSFAAREKADLIAIATHGRGGLARMLRGSVADAVMHAAHTSMLVLKPDSVIDKRSVRVKDQTPAASTAVVELFPG